VCELNGLVWLTEGQECTNTVHKIVMETKYLQWFLMYVDPQYGTGVMSPYWLLGF